MHKTGSRDDGTTAGGGTPVRRYGRPANVWSALKRISGMPDYPGYLAHMTERHGGCAVLSEGEYYDQYVNARYGNGASRCC